MDAKELIRLPDPREKVRIAIKEVVRDVFEKPHVFIRVSLTGWHFPQRALEPFAVVGDLVSRMVLISPDGLVADAYFDTHLPPTNVISFGYGKVIHWDFDIPVQREDMARLDRFRLPKGTIDPFHRLR